MRNIIADKDSESNLSRRSAPGAAIKGRPTSLLLPLHSIIVVCALAAVGCSGHACGAGDGQIVAIDGSSTVFPLSEAVAEEFQASNQARVTIGVSGTGGGFKKFCQEETAITGASRPIKESEVKLCAENDVDYIELPVAYDGIAVVVHKDNDWVDHLTVEELRKMWAPEGKHNAKTWADIRDGWPDEELALFGPGVDSGTYDYFTKAIVGKEHSSRSDFTSSEDDNMLVVGVSGNRHSLGFFGFAYYSENKDKLKIVPINDGDDSNGAGAVIPTPETVADMTYQPLSRPIFVYVSKDASDSEDVASFMDFYLQNAGSLAEEVGYIALPPKAYELAQTRFDKRIAGSVFTDGMTVGESVETLLASSAN